MEPASKAPAIEAPPENLQVLFDLVDNEIIYGNVRRPKYGSDATVERPKPRGSRGRRAYAVGGSWVTKMPTEPDVVAGEESPSNNSKILKRRRTADGADPKAAKGRQRQLQALAGASEASGQNCFNN